MNSAHQRTLLKNPYRNCFNFEAIFSKISMITICSIWVHQKIFQFQHKSKYKSLDFWFLSWIFACMNSMLGLKCLKLFSGRIKSHINTNPSVLCTRNLFLHLRYFKINKNYDIYIYFQFYPTSIYSSIEGIKN